MWKSSKNTAFSDVFGLLGLLGLLCLEGTTETGGGGRRREGGREGASMRGLAFRLAVLTHRKDVSVHGLKKKKKKEVIQIA